MESRKTWEQGSRLTFCFLLSLLPGHLLITSKGQVKHLFINILYQLPKNNCLNKSACTISPCRNMKEAVCGIKMWIFYQSDSKTTVFYSSRWQYLMVLPIQCSFAMQKKTCILMKDKSPHLLKIMSPLVSFHSACLMFCLSGYQSIVRSFVLRVSPSNTKSFR